MVVAKYIDNPQQVNGHKWDLRLYDAVTSYDPLSIYLNVSVCIEMQILNNRHAQVIF